MLGADAGLTHADASITDAAAIETVVAARRPEVVFNCAAYNAVDRAESEPDAAFAANAEGPANIALACRRHGAALVHFSTNFVFDGASPEPYLESDEPSPQSTYARSKLEGERRVLETGSHVLVVRTAAVFGGPRSFPARILERARAGEGLRVVSDQTVNPTYARDLAVAALDLAERGFAGIVHAVADGCCAWDELARVTLGEAGVSAEVESI
ncbi:MAG TPA: NAD(P)-dependent oxidoreductase, partial [Candidatus Dormibacteraeota bacterium]|nr:NAD(P)-dependent oxidoreductase [Candidatus Dormibacteraeota bacterium]